MAASGGDIGHAAVAQPLDFVLQPKLAFLEARQLELVDHSLGDQGGDLLIEAPVFDFQRLKLLRRGLVVVHSARVIHSRRDWKIPAAGEAVRSNLSPSRN